MEENWKKCKNLLCIRADNMGDLIMTGPALRALKAHIGCRITVLTSSMGKPILPHLPCVDDAIIADLPWVKTNADAEPSVITDLVAVLKNRNFDGVIIFTVYSQSVLPSAMLAFMAGIPLRLGYCRENPYRLLTHWASDEEPYTLIRHQVKRDLYLLETIGIKDASGRLELQLDGNDCCQLLAAKGIELKQNWLVLHPGVSETKREYPVNAWIDMGKALAEQTGAQLLITGSASEKPLAEAIAAGIGGDSVALAGVLTLPEFLNLVRQAPLVISVNTATAHIAAAFNTPVLVLYALTNPQHTPYSDRASVMYFSVPEGLESRNEVVRYVSAMHMDKNIPYPEPLDVAACAVKLLGNKKNQCESG